jgi:hypothetical protein
VGGCIVTSAEEFPEETQVPPVILGTPDLPLGAIMQFDHNRENELRLGITVSDDNIDDELEVHAELTVVGQSTTERVCPPKIGAGSQPKRDQFPLVIPQAQIKIGACNTLQVFVSREFVGTCTEDVEAFKLPRRSRDDVAQAQFYIWEISADPASHPEAAQAIFTSCPVMTQRATGSMTTVP